MDDTDLTVSHHFFSLFLLEWSLWVDPLIKLTQFLIGNDGFKHTPILIPTSPLSSSILFVEFPSVKEIRLGDRAFANTRLAPLCGSLATDQERINPQDCMNIFTFDTVLINRWGLDEGKR